MVAFINALLKASCKKKEKGKVCNYRWCTEYVTLETNERNEFKVRREEAGEAKSIAARPRPTQNPVV